ncbi:universal stress protein, partial [Enterococcus faecalis]|nr:universal stress protein [Enterococcus faecalis]
MEEQMYKNILVGVDGSDQANLAYERAIEVARRNGSRVIVANILENQVYTMMGYSTLNDQLIDQETAAAEELMACLLLTSPSPRASGSLRTPLS